MCRSVSRALSKGPLLSARVGAVVPGRIRDDPCPCSRRSRKRPPNWLPGSAHAFRARKAGFPAPRAACLFALHKTDFRPRKWPKNRLYCQTPRRNHPVVRAVRLYAAARRRADAGRGSRARTCDLRFWRPPLYQLSYTPSAPSRLPRSTRFLDFSAGPVKGMRLGRG